MAPAVRLAPVNVALSSVQEVGAGFSVLWALRLSHIQIDVGDMKPDILCKSTYRGHRSATHHQHLVTQRAAAEIHRKQPRIALHLFPLVSVPALRLISASSYLELGPVRAYHLRLGSFGTEGSDARRVSTVGAPQKAVHGPCFGAMTL